MTFFHSNFYFVNNIKYNKVEYEIFEKSTPFGIYDIKNITKQELAELIAVKPNFVTFEYKEGDIFEFGEFGFCISEYGKFVINKLCSENIKIGIMPDNSEIFFDFVEIARNNLFVLAKNLFYKKDDEEIIKDYQMRVITEIGGLICLFVDQKEKVELVVGKLNDYISMYGADNLCLCSIKKYNKKYYAKLIERLNYMHYDEQSIKNILEDNLSNFIK